jgi:hypothetical protein
VWLCRSLLSFAIHLAPPRNHGSEAQDAHETGSCSFTLAPVAYWREPAVCAKIWKAAAGGICVRYHAKSCDPIAITAQNGLLLQLVTMILVPPAYVLSWGPARSWATAVPPDSLAPSLAYQVLSDWLFMASHRCVG